MPIRAFVFDAYGTLFDTHSVAPAVESAFPQYGEFITQIWRQKQLEYSWLRTVMAFHADFGTVTRDALVYAVGTVGCDPDEATIDRVCAAFDRLQPFPEARETLTALSNYRLAILSNGSPAMLTALLGHAGFDRCFDAVISTDRAGHYKPHPDVYRSITEALKLPPDDVLLVSSNGFDLAGAKHFGLKTMRIERMPAGRLREALADPRLVEPRTMFAALRARPDTFAGEADFECSSLRELTVLASAIATPSTFGAR